MLQSLRRIWGKRLRVAGLLLAVLIASIGYGPRQESFSTFLALYAPAFLLYIYIYREVGSSREISFLLLTGALARLLLVPAMPQLSDDVFRFIWDGRLIAEGINPFSHPPVYYMEAPHAVESLSPELYAKLNSPEYFTVYPPLAQATFALSAWLFPRSIWGATMVMKLVLLFFEWIVLWVLPRLLNHFGLPEKGVLLYALNPLILIEVMGNLHFEGAMVCFLLLGLWWGANGKWKASAGAMGLAVAAKLLPLLFFPFFLRRLGWPRCLAYFGIVGGVLLLLFAPLLSSAFLSGFGNSLGLYFQRFEFNASIYYLWRWLGYRISGYNLIAYFGPLLALLTFAGIMAAALREQGKDWGSLPPFMLLAICLYLAFSPTVHPWYASLPVALAALTRFRFPILWSGLIGLTYINYSYPEYRENLWIVALEYFIVYAAAAWELFSGRNWLDKQYGRRPIFPTGD